MISTLRLAWRTPGCVLLLSGNFAVALGTNMVLPFLAIYLTQQQGISAVTVAVAITARFWAQQGLTLLGGWIVDRAGPVTGLCLGLAIRAVSYSVLAYLTAPALVIAACALLGFGGALYVPASKAALAALTQDGTDLKLVFSLRSAVNNAGNALGPPLGVAVLLAGPKTAFFVTAAVFAVLCLLLSRLRAPAARAAADRGAGGRVSVRALARIAVCAAAFGLCYIQLEFAVPVTTERAYGTAAVSLLFVVNAVGVVLLQLFTSRWSSGLPSNWVIGGGLAVFAAGFAAASFGHIAALVVCVLLLTVGEVLIDPTLDSEVAAAVPVARRGMAFGVVGTAIALGALVGNLVAARLLAAASLFAVLAAAAAALAAVALFWPKPAAAGDAGRHRAAPGDVGRHRARRRRPPAIPRQAPPTRAGDGVYWASAKSLPRRSSPSTRSSSLST